VRLIKRVSSVLTMFSIFASLSACTSNANAIKYSNDVKEIKIGVTLYKQDDTFISTITKNIEEIAKEKEGKVNIK